MTHEPLPRELIPVVIVSDHLLPTFYGAWVKRDAALTPRQGKTVLEIVCGRIAVMGMYVSVQQSPAYPGFKLHTADDEQWAKLIGLVIVDKAERIDI